MTTLGFQLYSAREFPPFSDVFAKVAKAGYKEVEGYGAMYASLDDAGLKAMRADLDSNGLTMPTGHFGLDLLESNPERALEIAGVLGIESIYAPHIMPDQRPSDAKGWHAFGARLEAAGRRFRNAGLDFGWHNHDFEFVKLADGSTPMEHIMAGGPGLSWEADIAWVVRGGADPFAWIETLGPRITAVHVKDIAPAGENTDEGGWADVGHGTLDWAKLMQALKSTGARHYVVEHDNPNDLDRVVTRSIASFKTY
ncbi:MULTISPECIES: sugar phosphate isomerase/epimerase family protein [unclassified Rhizobium]|uniref:sugar phosphate isomerase/epimerase family protein n=1 Tax=unclassified Rhizobium TaxID=2613769 RepID=UPI001ADD2260|nr:MULTISPECIES: sugar phosphate isomerase/epimerase [unclassified Rhizobium]MBO9098595.1 sugar phosphate isomerase/epimerase [Rhizobium sp. L58/93]MBO9132599.1 sugar phosphate isomerase/epimerase [Rhizobium sp. B209b/85]MBO9168861.1 sugar phosphate isomerase/epimerase [Rhizobium sp. L245/93]MBO9184811.1 sugar phosphate isomerase/epimerase [Rhizobium sp. E27B/91]QXZ84983.1 sugar phosphate isomerase/epimerase [Rhizobium sp. K1/93]